LKKPKTSLNPDASPNLTEVAFLPDGGAGGALEDLVYLGELGIPGMYT
jgi:hypothetical protein